MGASITDRPTTYKFRRDNLILRLFDTPGLADTKEIDFDRHACDQIMQQLSTFGVLHAIIIIALLKPDVMTLTARFRYNLVELLSNMHRSATDSVLFDADDETSIFLDMDAEEIKDIHC